MTEIVPVQPKKLARIGLTALPRLITDAGERADIPLVRGR